MWEIWAKLLLPKSLKSCPKLNKSPNLVTLTVPTVTIPLTKQLSTYSLVNFTNPNKLVTLDHSIGVHVWRHLRKKMLKGCENCDFSGLLFGALPIFEYSKKWRRESSANSKYFDDSTFWLSKFWAKNVFWKIFFVGGRQRCFFSLDSDHRWGRFVALCLFIISSFQVAKK